jgi:hypothetical protein
MYEKLSGGYPSVFSHRPSPMDWDIEEKCHFFSLLIIV